MKTVAHNLARIRPSVAAGRFYPNRPDQLRRLIHNYLKHTHPATGPAPKAIIVPHAGYPFSGPIAASA
ncbi:MAG TPA: AmmeMemoRadiSam system protein B, partial [Verrucomicrobiae bacterium]|nr:AmmeMemoRadiSam system protein B [Verrucomicrobiae bacterium]